MVRWEPVHRVGEVAPAPERRGPVGDVDDGLDRCRGLADDHRFIDERVGGQPDRVDIDPAMRRRCRLAGLDGKEVR